MHEAGRILKDAAGVSFAEGPMAALEGADALAIVTEWTEFRSPDFAAIKAKLKQATIFDGRNLYDPRMVRDLGFTYLPIGRPDLRAGAGA
jgi:UDPglucose 6-dehydrogenase